MMNYKKALVTGGAGFIGSHLTEKLHQDNIEVLVVDNLLTGKKEIMDLGGIMKEGEDKVFLTS